MGMTTDPSDPRLGHGTDTAPVPQNDMYLVLSEKERAKGFVRPVRRAYLHTGGEMPCGSLTTMNLALCETYARDPKFYGSTYCCHCRMHLPVAEFVWGRGRRGGGLVNGHGHVVPNPDGSKVRCGGPVLCAVCAREKAALAEYPHPTISDSEAAPSA